MNNEQLKLAAALLVVALGCTTETALWTPLGCDVPDECVDTVVEDLCPVCDECEDNAFNGWGDGYDVGYMDGFKRAAELHGLSTPNYCWRQQYVTRFDGAPATQWEQVRYECEPAGGE